MESTLCGETTVKYFCIVEIETSSKEDWVFSIHATMEALLQSSWPSFSSLSKARALHTARQDSETGRMIIDHVKELTK